MRLIPQTYAITILTTRGIASSSVRQTQNSCLTSSSVIVIRAVYPYNAFVFSSLHDLIILKVPQKPCQVPQKRLTPLQTIGDFPFYEHGPRLTCSNQAYELAKIAKSITTRAPGIHDRCLPHFADKRLRVKPITTDSAKCHIANKYLLFPNLKRICFSSPMNRTRLKGSPIRPSSITP